MPNPAAQDYTPINWRPLSIPDSFRLIKLAPGQANDPLSCSLIEVTFDGVQGRYLALSYVWGSPVLTHVITCNNHTVHVTHNVHSALRRIRHISLYLYIWCDALCIKQGKDAVSLLERSKQIPLMSRIFSYALRVFVDLGDEDGTLAQAVTGINSILSTSQELRKGCHLSPKPLEYLGLPEFKDPMWSALAHLLSRPWFMRIWCVQEAVLARDIQVVFGGYSVTFEQLIAVASVYFIVSQTAARVHQTATWDLLEFNRPRTATECLLATWQKRKLRISPTDFQAISLCDLMISTMSQHSTDRRDRVYALYGMINSQTIERLPVSYSEPINALSIRVSLYFVDNGNGVWMLVHSGGIRSNRPSWTIDLVTIGDKEKFDPLAGQTRATGQNPLYGAGGTAEPLIRVDPSIGCLRVSGVVVDGLASMPDTFSVDLPIESIAGHRGASKMAPQLVMSYIKAIDAIVRWSEEGDTMQPDSDALWRTLIANYNPHLDDLEREPCGRALPGFRSHFHELLLWIRSILDADPPINMDNLFQDDIENLRIPFNATKHWIAMIGPNMGRRVARTGSGALALIPQSSSMSDVIAVFQGIPVPFVLRKDVNDVYCVVGICYVHGLMDGEALRDGMQLQEILLQ